jgi:hypothetical protein
MNIDQDDEHDDEHNHGNGYSPAVEEIDLFGAAIALCQVAQRAKTVEGALKRLRKVGRDILAAERRRDALIAEVEQTKTALAEREAAVVAGEVALDERRDKFEASVAEAHDQLRRFHNSLAEEDRRIRYRILSSANLLHGYNAQLQDLPSWDTIGRMVPGLPPDLPAAPAVEVISENVREDWSGNVFVPGSSLTRTMRGAA